MALDLRPITRKLDKYKEKFSSHRPFPLLFVKIKLVWRCNLRCGMCHHWRSKAEQPLPTQRFFEVIDELAQLGCHKIKLSGGEPLLHPDLIEIVSRASSHGIHVGMTSNGSLIDAEKAAALAKAGLRNITVSLDGSTADVHDQIRAVPGAFDATVNAIRELAANGVRVTVNTIVAGLNYESMAAMPDFVADLGATSWKLIALKSIGDVVKKVEPEQKKIYRKKIAPIVAERGLARGLFAKESCAYPFGVVKCETTPTDTNERGQAQAVLYEQIPCFAPFFHTFIEHDGKVKVCCIMRREPILGDLKEQSFIEIWQGKTYRSLRKCKKLPMFDRCRSCHEFTEENKSLAELFWTAGNITADCTNP